MTAIAVLAPAKINLGLAVTGKRPDGYHNIWSVFQAITLFDRIELVWPGSGRVRMSGLDLIPEQNLMGVAAAAMADATGRRIDFDMVLQKRIPVAAGLGGGSADAAAVILALCHKWELAPSSRDVQAVAASVGSDLPFFLSGGSAVVTGRGDQVTPIPSPESGWVLVATPDLELEQKTARLYAALKPSDFSPPPDDSTVGIRETGNAFLRPLLELCPGFAETYATIVQSSEVPVRLSGAGPSLFSWYPTFMDATLAAQRIRKAGLRHLHVARPVNGPMPLSERGTPESPDAFSR